MLFVATRGTQAIQKQAHRSKLTPNSSAHSYASPQERNNTGPTYTVAMPSFLAAGGSKHWKEIGDLQLKRIKGTRTDNQVLRSFIEKNSPLTQKVEGRWKIVYPDSGAGSSVIKDLQDLMANLYNYIM